MNKLIRLVSPPAPFLFATLTLSVAVALLVGCTKPADSVFPTTTSSDGIIGGQIVSVNHPLAKNVALLVNNDLKANLCTVTILSQEYAVTAAHCIEVARAESFTIAFGTHFNAKTPTRKVVFASAVRSREGRQTETHNAFDIALITFSGGLPPGYAPAKLLPETYLNLLKVGTSVVAAGYGIPEETSEDIDTLRMVSVKIANPHFTPTELQVDQTNGRGACKGDSGGPAFAYINGQYYFWGVTSRGANRAGELVEGCDQYVIYTNAILFMPALANLMSR